MFENNNPLMFIETYKEDIKIEKVCKFDSRKQKLKDLSIKEFNIENFKIYKYLDKTIIPYKSDDKKIYGIIVSKIEGSLTLDLNESIKFEEIKL